MKSKTGMSYTNEELLGIVMSGVELTQCFQIQYFKKMLSVSEALLGPPHNFSTSSLNLVLFLGNMLPSYIFIYIHLYSLSISTSVSVYFYYSCFQAI